MKPTAILIRILAAASIGFAPLHAASPELQATASKLYQAHADSVVWLSVIAKTSMSVDGDAPAEIKSKLSGEERETTVETTGTFISKDGLLVTALGKLDRSSMMDGQTVNTPMGPIKLKSESEVTEIKVIMPDGTEIPADLVLKDVDLGLGFIKLRMDSDEASGVEIHSIDLADSSEGKILDDCIGIDRMDESLNREPAMSSGEISGITTKPRRFYRVDMDSTGCPVFLSSGKLLGITVVRKPSSGLGGGAGRMTPVVLPAAEVAKIAEQAKEAKPEVVSEDEDESSSDEE
ncbi:trypsin-like peptidase domain-containing protein [Haloferula sp.]|uniref:trypsin-like peptidase domain-containing protein n=1 Tax=Haloferula sp. TaxID=2497595 RepID=UPI003C7395B7